MDVIFEANFVCDHLETSAYNDFNIDVRHAILDIPHPTLEPKRLQIGALRCSKSETLVVARCPT